MNEPIQDKTDDGYHGEAKQTLEALQAKQKLYDDAVLLVTNANNLLNLRMSEATAISDEIKALKSDLKHELRQLAKEHDDNHISVAAGGEVAMLSLFGTLQIRKIV